MEAETALQPRTACLLTLQDVKELVQVSPAVWRATGALVARCGVVEGIIDGQPCRFEFSEWEDRDFVADHQPPVRPPVRPPG